MYARSLKSRPRAFVAAFRKKFNTDPDAHAALAYDATKLVAQALAAKGPDRKAIRDYLHSLNRETSYPGLTGPAYFEDTGDPVGMRFKVFRVRNGLLTVADSAMYVAKRAGGDRAHSHLPG